ncbi:MAG: ATP-binding protein [Microcoleaceae cyanobacterium MO_207.B10]|nr:ATP-binding protein [Microcoleaceae cyanobacterium MO_207.B10]
MFESFYRGDNIGTIQGVDLGLSIVKKCLDLSGGEVTFTSELGEGTEFIVTLPLRS